MYLGFDVAARRHICTAIDFRALELAVRLLVCVFDNEVAGT
jgi:hypothetical protein